MDEKPKPSIANLALVGFAAGVLTVLLVVFAV
jgi:hypothetical protein